MVYRECTLPLYHQTKRNNREIARLQQTLEHCREINEQLLDESVKQADSELKTLLATGIKILAVNTMI